MQKEYHAGRYAVAVMSLLLLLNSGLFTAAALYRYFGPRDLMSIDQPLIAIPLIVLALLGAIASLLFGGFAGAIVWLIVMKPLLNKSELISIFALDRGSPSRMNRVIKRIVDVV